ncbi:hypothetical protein PVAND_015492 [Polypedilum vanderplanki]|uniref:Peptidase S1 domain-containing protein n=1 Tax=Polypedilum vanderplanki TaxID=319348 RepID=A0A9J6BCB5_POLVA|nr:hypothetical protein PVAND_015492 [Polypedilum vanderplanki]
MLKFLLFTVLFASVSCSWTDDLINLFTPSKRIAREENQGNARVIGGEDAPEHIPYQISMQYKRGNSGAGNPLFPFLGIFNQQDSNNNQSQTKWSHFCGGSVLNENHIVTAAHCVDGMNISRMSIFAGESDLRNEDKGSRHLIESCVIHPDYVELNNSDVAVCKLQTSFPKSEKIQPIPLDKTYVGGGENCMLSGWGYTTRIKGAPLPNKLQRANFTSLTNEECNQRGHSVGNKEICAYKFSKGACNGDSGGPLQCNNVLVGIVSYGTAICGLTVPDVYTRASEFVDWINENSN